MLIYLFSFMKLWIDNQNLISAVGGFHTPAGGWSDHRVVVGRHSGRLGGVGRRQGEGAQAHGLHAGVGAGSIKSHGKFVSLLDYKL